MAKHQASHSKGPCIQTVYRLWPQSTYIGTTLRPKYLLFGYMDPQGYGCYRDQGVCEALLRLCMGCIQEGISAFALFWVFDVWDLQATLI